MGLHWRRTMSAWLEYHIGLLRVSCFLAFEFTYTLGFASHTALSPDAMMIGRHC